MLSAEPAQKPSKLEHLTPNSLHKDQLCVTCPARKIMEEESHLMTEKDVARVLNRSIASIRDWRRRSERSGKPVGPRFFRQEGRIYYLKTAVAAYLSQTIQQSDACPEGRNCGVSVLRIIALILIIVGITFVNSDSNPDNNIEDKFNRPVAVKTYRRVNKKAA